jgi:hypothetical protein
MWGFGVWVSTEASTPDVSVCYCGFQGWLKCDIVVFRVGWSVRIRRVGPDRGVYPWCFSVLLWFAGLVEVWYCGFQGWLKCEDSACGSRQRRLPLMFQRGHPVCPVCQRGIMLPEVRVLVQLAWSGNVCQCGMSRDGILPRIWGIPRSWQSLKNLDPGIFGFLSKWNVSISS